MSEYIRYLYKTVRKYFGEAVIVTQEVDDIISSPIVKETIINNADARSCWTSANTSTNSIRSRLCWA